jgi:hypothetical protein
VHVALVPGGAAGGTQAEAATACLLAPLSAEAQERAQQLMIEGASLDEVESLAQSLRLRLNRLNNNGR